MLQVINRVLQNKEDNTKISLMFGNVSEQDIFLKEEIDKLANENSDDLKCIMLLINLLLLQSLSELKS